MSLERGPEAEVTDTFTEEAPIPVVARIFGPVESGRKLPTRVWAVLIVLVVLCSATGAANILAWARLKAETGKVTSLSEHLADSELALAQQAEQAKAYAALLDQYQQIVRSYQERLLEANISLSLLTANLSVNASQMYISFSSASVTAPAVRTVVVGRSVTYEGVATTLSLEMIPGKGRVLVNTKPLMGQVFQDTAVLAKETAETLSGKSLANYDLIFSIEAPAEIPGVDGPSAGAAMCLLVLALVSGESLDPGVAVTGTIQPDGTVGEIGGLLEKAQAAKASGSTTFLISEQNSKLTIYKEGTITSRGRVYRTLVAEQVSTEEYIEENVGIQVELVRGVRDLLRLASGQE